MESSIPLINSGVFGEVRKFAKDLIKSCENRACHEAELADANTPHITNSKQDVSTS